MKCNSTFLVLVFVLAALQLYISWTPISLPRPDVCMCECLDCDAVVGDVLAALPQNNTQPVKVITKTRVITKKEPCPPTAVIPPKPLCPDAPAGHEHGGGDGSSKPAEWHRRLSIFMHQHSHDKERPAPKLSHFHRIGEALPRLAAYHKRVLAQLAAGKDTGNAQFLVLSPHTGTGLGNILRAVLGAAYISFLTGRVFLINWEQEFFNPGAAQIHWHHKAVGGRLPLDKCQRFCVDGGKCGDGNENLDALAKKNLDEVLRGKCVHITMAFSPFFDWLSKNKYHSGTLRRITMTNMHAPVLKALLVPTAAMQERLQPYLQLFKDAPFVVGIQVRTGIVDGRLLSRDQKPKTIAAILKCASRMAKHQDKDVRFFVTSDHSALTKDFQDTFGTRVIVTSGKAEHTAITRRGERRDRSKAFLDWYLLGQVDVLFASFHCSFVQTAAARTNVMTYWWSNDMNHDFDPQIDHLSIAPLCSDLLPLPVQ